VSGFGPPRRTATSTYAIVRFPAAGPAPAPVVREPLNVLRFGEPYAAVDLLPAGR
jgi:hypothetical protein